MNKINKYFLLFLLISPILLSAQQKPDSTFQSPHHTVYYFLYYQQQETYDLSKSARALFEGGTKQKEELASKLKAVLDGNGLFVHINNLPRDPNYTDSVSLQNIYTLFPDKMPDIYLEKYGDRWLFSGYTLDRIPSLYSQTYPYLVIKLLEILPGQSGKTILGVHTWQWMASLFIIVICGILYLLFYFLSLYLIHNISNRYITHLRDQNKKKKRLAVYLSIWLTTGVFLLFLPSLLLPVAITKAIFSFAKIIRIVVLIFVFLRAADIVFVYARSYVLTTPGKLDNQLLPIIERVVQFLLVLVGLLTILHHLEVNVTALIAGVSIGGLALALAAQDTVKNFIGSAMIFIDKPFQIGDYIESANYAGTVEEVGFRSVRLRNVDRSVISVPNGNVASDTIINLGLRPMRRVQLNIGVTYNTPPEKIDRYLNSLRTLVEKHPYTSKIDYIIRFHSLGASSLDIFFRVYIIAATLADELRIREELIFGIVKLASMLQISFAFPSTSLYIEQNVPLESKPLTADEVENAVEHFLNEFEEKFNPKKDDHEDSGA
jgi:MscS family membrane protein